MSEQKSEQESMLGAWSMTLGMVLTGLQMACARMVLVGEENKILEVLGKDMRDSMRFYTPGQRQALASMLARLSEMAVRVEPPS